jgi:peptide-N4-(N-acetyl-beta-glucosaminyl)asparagine amidase
VMLYEDPNLKRKALNVIPVDELKSRARAKLDAYKSSSSLDADPSPLDFEDFLLLELLAWFKNEFFTWTNQPECRVCATSQNMRFIRSDRPNRDEIAGMAGNVEVYELDIIFLLKHFLIDIN